MKSFLIHLLILTFPLFIFSQTQLSEEVRAEIESRVKGEINPSIAVGIIDKDGHHYFSFGTKRMGGATVDEHTIYEIGSISKVFTGIMLAQQAKQGNMNLDDPIAEYLRGVEIPSKNGEQITLGHLSDHTSALPRLPDNLDPADPQNPYADYTEEQLYEFLEGHELRRKIGSQYEYSNLAQGLLGHILEKQADKSYEEMMIERIAQPLGMSETKINFDEHMRTKLAIGHNQGSEAKNWDITVLAGAGGIRSSVHDMLLFLEANMGLKETDLYPAMQLSHTERHDKGGTHVGLGWHINKNKGETVIWHNGGTGGYRAFAGFNPAKNMGVVLLTNSTESVDDIGFHLLNPSSKLRKKKQHIASVLRQNIDNKGVKAAHKAYEKIKEKSRKDYDFGEGPINTLGYHYLNQKNVEAALAIFKINTENHPKSANVWDSYAEALMENGQKEAAIENYHKSLELNPANQNAIDKLKKLGVEVEMKEVEVSEETLQSYVGKYQLAPGFEIEITREGKQLFGQATGQPRFELFASDETKFYLKVVEAQVHFNLQDGEVESLTLFQAGQEIKGKRVSE